jgi:hypothetical protein
MPIIADQRRRLVYYCWIEHDAAEASGPSRDLRNTLVHRAEEGKLLEDMRELDNSRTAADLELELQLSRLDVGLLFVVRYLAVCREHLYKCSSMPPDEVLKAYNCDWRSVVSAVQRALGYNLETIKWGNRVRNSLVV